VARGKAKRAAQARQLKRPARGRFMKVIEAGLDRDGNRGVNVRKDRVF
jgi:hypothetical protein